MEKLKKALNDISDPHWTIEKLQECPTSDLALLTPCFIAFFALVERAESIAEVCREAQAEVIEARSRKGAEWPRDLNLVLLVGENKLPDYARVRELVDDRYVCRKFVLNLNGSNILDVLADLPFWPPDEIISGVPIPVGAGVQQAVKGYDSALIADLASHSPGAERIFERIRQGKYNLTAEASMGEIVQPQRLSPLTLTKLEALDISDFRGIRKLLPEDIPLSGDVVFIYGPNGVGKTSIADALEWTITGQLSRLQLAQSHHVRCAPDPIVNVFSDKGEAQVTCHLSNREPICRRKKSGLSMQRLIGSRPAGDDRAVIDYAVGTRAPSREARLGIGRLRDLFRSSHMLSQHDIRQFLERTKPSERFDILTNMIGAEEFVRFREKVSSVMRHLRPHLGDLAEQTRSLKRQLEDLSTRLRERQKELDGLSNVMAAGKAPEDLIRELLQGLRNCQCTINETAIEQTASEPAEHRFELIAGQAETSIRRKKAETEDLLVRLNSLDQEVQGYEKSRTHRERLAIEIANLKAASKEAHAELQNQEKARQDIQTHLLVLKTKQSQVAKKYTDLNWFKENLPFYHRIREILQNTENSLKGQREEFQRSEAVLEEEQNSLSAQRARLQEIDKARAFKVSREQPLNDLLKRLPLVQERRRVSEQLDNTRGQLDSRIAESKQQLDSIREEMNRAQARLDELQSAYNSEADRHDILSSFLAQLGELLHSAECPLCGTAFHSAEEAMQIIKRHLSSVPLQLRDLARRLDQAKKDTENKQANAVSITARIRDMEAEVEQIRLNQAATTRIVKDFLAECAALAVTVSAEDTSEWQTALEEARKESDIALLNSEATIVRDKIDKLELETSELQNTADEFRRKLAHNEREYRRVLTAVQEIEAEIVKRGFKPDSIPPDHYFTIEELKAQYEAREYEHLVVGREAELRASESAIAGLREGIRKADEDAASKETQLRQHEAACSRFVAVCQAVGVTPENPRESLQEVKRRALDINQSLSGLEEKRQILQQIASLSRLKKEMEGLTQGKSDAQRQAEKSSREESLLREWVSRVESLEADVVNRQVDVVGTHLIRLEPTTQRLYHRLNAHPIFGKVRIQIDEKTRELNVEAEASAARELLGDIAVSPSEFFSDAQMNSLAITVFLAGALRQRWSGFNTIIIDDPVQQMDEMNVCAFLDLIRGLSSQRQFIIFTCSKEFYLLAMDKLDCLNKAKQGSFLAYRLEGISPAQLKVHNDAS